MDSANLDVKNIFAVNLSRILTEKSITRKQLCSDCNIKYTTFCDWINGNTEPKLESIEKISNYLGIRIADFFVELDKPSDPIPRLVEYQKLGKELSVETLLKLSEEEITKLTESGFVFSRLSLEEYSKLLNRPIAATPELDWGEPVEGETW